MEKDLLKNILPDETADYLRKWDIWVIQGKKGYRFAVDSLIAASLADIPSRGKVADLGAGCGVISFIVARKSPNVEVYALELQPQLADRAERSARLNNLSDKVHVVLGSFKDVKRLFPAEAFSYVISNPPFWPLGRGRISPDRERAVAMSEVEGSVGDVIEAAYYLLPTKGTLGIIFCAERAPELFYLLRKGRFEPKRVVFVHPRLDEDAQFVFVESKKNARPGQCRVEPPLIIYSDGDYTEEMRRLIGV